MNGTKWMGAMRRAVLLVLATAALAQAQDANFDWIALDGKGFDWQVACNGCGRWGKNKIYDGISLFEIRGQRHDWDARGRDVHPPIREIKAKADLEYGPWTCSNLQVRRRVTVSKTQAWCRWIDTLENPGNADIKVPIHFMTNLRSSCQTLETASGAKTVGADDDSFLTSNGDDSDLPTTCHVFATGNAPVRPKVRAARGQHLFHYDYDLTVPARGRVAIVSFESQQPSLAEAREFLKTFDARRALADVPADLRRCIINMNALCEPWLELPRDARLDRVVLDKTVLQGTIADRDVVFPWRLGSLTLKSGDIAGMFRDSEFPLQVWVVLADGQAMRGPCPQGDLQIDVDGNTMKVPLSTIKSWSYRLSDRRAAEPRFDGPSVLLRTGERFLLAARPGGTFRAAGVEIAADSNALAAITFDPAPATAVWLHLANGSMLAAKGTPHSLDLPLAAGIKALVPVSQIEKLHFAAPSPNVPPMELRLRDGSVVRGKLPQTELEISGVNGKMTISLADMHTLTATAGSHANFSLHCWGKAETTCQPTFEKLTVEVGAGLTLAVPVGSLAVLRQVLPMSELTKRVAPLLADLGAEDFKLRRDATDELIRMGPEVAPLLEKHPTDDAEVRLRIETILKHYKRRNTPPAEDNETSSPEQMIKLPF